MEKWGQEKEMDEEEEKTGRRKDRKERKTLPKCVCLDHFPFYS